MERLENIFFGDNYLLGVRVLLRKIAGLGTSFVGCYKTKLIIRQLFDEFFSHSDFLHLKGDPYVNNVFLPADVTKEIKMYVLSWNRLVRVCANKSMCNDSLPVPIRLALRASVILSNGLDLKQTYMCVSLSSLFAHC